MPYLSDPWTAFIQENEQFFQRALPERFESREREEDTDIVRLVHGTGPVTAA